MVSFLTKPFKKMFKINRAKVVAQQNSEKNRRWEKTAKVNPVCQGLCILRLTLASGASFSWKIDESALSKKVMNIHGHHPFGM